MRRCRNCGECGHDRRTCNNRPIPKRVWCPKDSTPVVSSDGTGRIDIIPTSSTSTLCECGGTTGICGTAEGARKWRAHQQTDQHMKWEDANL